VRLLAFSSFTRFFNPLVFIPTAENMMFNADIVENLSDGLIDNILNGLKIKIGITTDHGQLNIHNGPSAARLIC